MAVKRKKTMLQTRRRNFAAKNKASAGKKGVHPGTKEFEWTLAKISEHIQTRAYYLWEEMGKPQVNHDEIWKKAERQVLSQLMKK